MGNVPNGVGATITLSADEREAIDYARDKCFMEAERLVEMKLSKKADPAGAVRSIVFWHRLGELLGGLYERSAAP